MKRRDMLKALGFGVGAVTLSGSKILYPRSLPIAFGHEGIPGQQKTNIILINVDDLGWTDLPVTEASTMRRRISTGSQHKG